MVEGKCKTFRLAGWILLFALVIFGAQAFGIAVVEAENNILTSKDGLWQYEYFEEASGETVVAVDEYNGSDRDLVIPEQIDGYVVRYISNPEGWGYNSNDNNRFDSITISDSVIGTLEAPFFIHSQNLKFVYVGKNYGKNASYDGSILQIGGGDIYDVHTREYRISSENEKFAVLDGVLYTKDMTGLSVYPSLKEDNAFTVPDGVRSIENYAINNQQYLEKFVLSDGVEWVDRECFKGSSIKNIIIGSGLSGVGAGGFYGMPALEMFQVSEENPNYKSEKGMLLTKDGSTLVQYVAAGKKEFAIPEGVAVIGPYACYGMPYNEITIPDTVVSLGNYAFNYCTKAEMAYVPASVEKIGISVFLGCASLKKVTIDAPVAMLNDGFDGCDALTEFTLPETVTSITDLLFIGKSLRTVHLKSPKAPSISYTMKEKELIEKCRGIRIFVPEGAQGYDVLPWSRMNVVYGDTVVVEQLMLNPSSVVLDVGETAAVQAVVLPEDAMVQDIVWETSDEGVASVDANGRIKAISSGTARIKAAVGGISTECMVVVRGNQPILNFRVETSGGTASSNYNAQNYYNWSSPVKSYLFEDEGNCLTRVEFINGRLVYETYSIDGILKKSGSIKNELPLEGGFYVSGRNRFVVYGQENSEESSSVEVMRIVKYGQDWNRLSSCSLYGANTLVPFDGGSLRFAECGDTLYIRTSHTKYDGHQANMQVAVDMPAMEITDTYTLMGDIEHGGYVAHSFNQFLQMDGEDLVTLDHGDGLPRAAVLIKYPGIQHTTFMGASVEYIEALKFPGLMGNNDTGASLGGLELSEHYYIFAGNNANDSNSSVRNIFVNITNKDFLRNQGKGMIYLTDFKEGSDVTVSTPQLVKINEKTFLVLWNETNASGTAVHSQMIDEDGNRVTKEQSFHGSLSDCHPIVHNGQVVWYYTGTKGKDTAPIFCRVPVDGREAKDNLLQGDKEQAVKKLSQCKITLGKSSYTYNGKPKMPSVTVKDGTKVLAKNIDYTIAYSNNVKAGTAKVTVKGKGDYKGTVTKNFTITIKKGTSHKIGSFQYKVTGTSTVSVAKVKDNKMTKAKVPKTVKIGGKTFKVTAIGSNAFKGNKKITSIEIGDNVKVIGVSALEGCTKLSKAALGKGITEIKENAFKNCKKLGTIGIKSIKLKKVGRNALKGIKPTAKVKVPAKKLSAYKRLFRNKGQGNKVKIVK